MKEILQRDHPTLRAKAKPVPISEIRSGRLAKIVSEMAEAMASQKDGIAIAAPQIGYPLRLFLVSGRLLGQADKSYRGDKGDLVFVNPEIVRSSRDKREVEEGCLSVRWLYGKVRRSTRVTIKALDERGERTERGASGLLAQIFQHEMDHLEGILFTDRARELWEMSAAEIAELNKR
ncbi:MAG: peptide deformylase [Cyanobacteria bacterium REEB65]|nr:peptide deformylase [Cyanobacteria bacterium REEB65]